LATRLQQARLASSPAATATAPAFEPADPEAEEIKQLEAMIKDSPDLINAYQQGAPENPLLTAVGNRQLKVAAFLLDHKANLEARSRSPGGDTPLLVAARQGDKEMVELLLNRGADVGATVTQSRFDPRLFGEQPGGNTALHYAAEHGYKSVAEVLLAHGANVDAQSIARRTPLHLAAQKGFKAVAELLLAHGANPNLKDYHGNTPLHLAVQADNEAMVELLLASKSDVNSKDQDGRTALHFAASQNRAGMTKLLLARGADVNAATIQGATPLMETAGTGGPEVIKLLLANKADVNARRNDGFSALLWAVDDNRLENAKLLLASGAEVDIKNDQEVSPLQRAVGLDSLEMVKAILERKPDLEIRDVNGRTPLQLAVIKPQLEIAGLLLDAGADPNVPYKDVDNASPLQLAAVRLDKPMVELLVAHKADLNLQDRYGSTALSRIRDLAARGSSPRSRIVGGEIAELLRRAGADENLQRLSIIGVSRGDFEQNLFTKETNSYNRYTLFELIAKVYGSPGIGGPHARSSEPPGLRFPDFGRITISRMVPGGESTKLQANLQATFQSMDCSGDQSLQWGDIVEIPESDHLVNETWGTLPDEVRKTLEKCLSRTVEIVIKGETNKFTLNPGFDRVAPGPQPVFGGTPVGAAPGQAPVLRLSSFDFKVAVHAANVIREASDLSHVKVKRTDPANGKITEFVLSMESCDFWLRDGDVIEIPEKP
jgi:ankyrin repeat protein